MKNKAFTLVELIVVITILAVLGTIAFVSFQGYAKTSRDSVRVSDIANIEKGFHHILAEGGTFPVPDDVIQISASGTLLLYQGTLGEEQLGKLGVYNGGIDPLDKTPYLYSTNINQTKYQILGYLESRIVQNIIPSNYAVNLLDRPILLKGDILGHIVDKDTGIGIISDIDISTATGEYGLYLSKQQGLIIGDSSSLLLHLNHHINPEKNCNNILKNGLSIGDGEYNINIIGTGTIKVFCDMTHAGGGWTLVGNWNKLGLEYTNSQTGNINNYDNAGWKLSDSDINSIMNEHIMLEAQGIGDYKEYLFCDPWIFNYSSRTSSPTNGTQCSRNYSSYSQNYVTNSGFSQGYSVSHWNARDVWLRDQIGSTEGSRWEYNTGMKDSFLTFHGGGETLARPDIKIYVK